MKIGVLFKWFGSKWQSAKRYPAPLPGLPLFEPYAGGAGYSLNHCDMQVTIWEENTQLQVLWAWLIAYATEAKIREIPVGLPVGTDIRVGLGLSYGQQLLLKHWQRTNNVGNCWTISPWGDKPGQWTENTRARVAEQVQAIKHWNFAPVGYNKRGTYFVDPPYQYNYRYREFQDFNYSQLVQDVALPPNGSLVICCEAACPKTGAVPTYLPFVPNHTSVTSRRKATQSHHSKELVYIRA